MNSLHTSQTFSLYLPLRRSKWIFKLSLKTIISDSLLLIILNSFGLFFLLPHPARIISLMNVVSTFPFPSSHHSSTLSLYSPIKLSLPPFFLPNTFLHGRKCFCFLPWKVVQPGQRGLSSQGRPGWWWSLRGFRVLEKIGSGGSDRSVSSTTRCSVLCPHFRLTSTHPASPHLPSSIPTQPTNPYHP